MDLAKVLQFVPVLIQIGLNVVEREATAKNMTVEELLESGAGEWQENIEKANELKSLG